MHARKVNVLSVLLPTILLFASYSSPAQFSISNETLRVDLNVASGQFNITALPSQQTFVTGGQFLSTNGVGSSGLTTNSIFGAGQIIDIVYPNGNRDDVMLFSNLPFAIFQSTLSNGTAQTVISNSIRTLTLPEDLQEPAGFPSVRGTGGLSPGANPGGTSSYEWLAIADPTNRFGVVNGWITDDGATGLVNCTNAFPSIQVNPVMQYGRLPIAPGQTIPLEMFAIGYFDDARVGLETWANTVAKVYNIHLPPQPTGFSTYPAIPHSGPCDSTNLPIVSSFASTNLEQFGFSVIQVDGRWEAGSSTNGNSPPRNFSTTTNVYPDGMKPMADYITSLGLTPGIWFQPFSGTTYDPFFTNHLDWFVTTNGGIPFFTGNFGGWALDMTYPPARNYVSNMVSTFAHDWGFRYFKMDAFAAGLAVPVSGQSVHPFGDAIFYDTNKTPVQVFRSGIQLLRQAAGTNVFFLGCNIPQNMRSYGASFGLVDAMRVGMDQAAGWPMPRGVESGSSHYFLNGRVWYDDPDTVYARTNLLLSQAQAYCSFVGLLGELTIDGDWLPDQTPDRINILQRIIPSHGLFARPVDYFETDPPSLWLLTDTNRLIRRDVIGAFNWGGADETFNVSLSHIGLPLTNYVGFDFWSNSLIPSISNSLQITVPIYSCSIIAVRPVSNRPQLISTSRHITQGMVDVLSESWSDAANSLSGQSLVVGGDSYELRVVVPDNAWQAVSATVSAADQSAGVTTAFSQSGNLVRATILSPTNRQVSWSIGFTGPPASPPSISAFSLANQNVQIGGTNGIWNYPFYLLGSTNLSLRSSNWQVLSTDYFDPGGNFSLTNPTPSNAGQNFYRLMLP